MGLVARALQKLSDTSIKSSKLKTGRHSYGGGLYLVVTASGSKKWSFMWKSPGAKWNREMGLGTYPDVPLAKARLRATECRQMVADGRDPVEERKKEAEPSFGEAADQLIESMKPSWRNDKHRAQWEMTLTVYCKDIRAKRVSEVSTEDVLLVLRPIWHEKPETASRLRGRIERVLSFAKSRGWRSGENPAVWRDHLKNLLPAPRKLTRGHHSALPYKDVAAFFPKLQRAEGLAARALEFLILNASRTGEVIRMRWAEVDLAQKLWTVPGARMKGGKIHRVPLSARSVEILEGLGTRDVSEFVFPGETKQRTQAPEKPLSQMSLTMVLRRLGLSDYTVHGFRSSFRDWAGDETVFAREVVEAALAHEVGNETERAYRRSDALSKRRRLMESWSSWCLSTTSQVSGSDEKAIETAT